MTPIDTSLSAALAALSEVPRSPAALAPLPDSSLLEAARTVAAIERLAATVAALIAADVARRSSRDLGHAGLAQRSGYRTPEELVRATSGSTARGAAEAVRVGSQLATPAPWLAPVAAAVLDGSLSVAAASSIRTGLGEPTAHISETDLADAATELCALASVGAAGPQSLDPLTGRPLSLDPLSLDPLTGLPLAADPGAVPLGSPALDADRIYRRARELRDELDEAGIAERERARREARSLRFVKQSDGMSLLIWKLDPESAAVCGELYDRATSPRRGGPRFMNPDDLALSESLSADARTTEQLASDVFLDLLRHGADADSRQLLGTGAPVMRAVVRAVVRRTAPGASDTFAGTVSGTGTATDAPTHGWLEGQTDPVSIETIDRLACAGAVQHVILSATGQPLDLGRQQRLFSRHQRIALAIRDGGCRWPGCDRPPSWTEAHHIKQWDRDHGSTDLENGILLCRHHHLLLHNNHWQITVDGADYWLTPPPTVDPTQQRRLMPSKSPVVRELLRTGARELAATH
jgi:hypothetical protein